MTNIQNKTISKFACFKMAINHFFMFNKAPKRISRREYWSFILYSILFAILFSILYGLLLAILFSMSSVTSGYYMIPWRIFCGMFYVIFFTLTIYPTNNNDIIIYEVEKDNYYKLLSSSTLPIIEYFFLI